MLHLTSPCGRPAGVAGTDPAKVQANDIVISLKDAVTGETRTVSGSTADVLQAYEAAGLKDPTPLTAAQAAAAAAAAEKAAAEQAAADKLAAEVAAAKAAALRAAADQAAADQAAADAAAAEAAAAAADLPPGKDENGNDIIDGSSNKISSISVPIDDGSNSDSDKRTRSACCCVGVCWTTGTHC